MISLFAITPSRCAAMLLALSLTGCSSLGNLVSGEKVDYRSQNTKAQALDVPPDLSQLAREGRYQPQSGVVSASTLRQPAAAAAPGALAGTVAPNALGDMRIERLGNSRWLVSKLPPEQLYPLLRSFWIERGFVLAVDNPEIGLMETDWAENRANLGQDVLRRTLGKVFDSLYSTPERDKYRSRIERSAAGTEIHISHSGMMEIYTTEFKDRTVWQPRPSNPELEAEFLSRLMVKLGAKEDTARSAVAAAPMPAATAIAAAGAAAAPRSSTLPATATLQLNEGFDRAWRLVGLALDRSGFTVEDRDRGAGLYFVRYVDPKLAGKEANFLSKLFGATDGAQPQRMRLLIKSSGNSSLVTVQDSNGAADNGEVARTIAGKLSEEINR